MRKPNGQEEFWTRVKKTDGCWLWQGRRQRHGYGQFDMNSAVHYAHRVAWMFTYGPIKDGLDIMHKCDNPPCVNPEHLTQGTHSENMADKVAKGRQPRGENNVRSKLTEAHIRIIKTIGRSLPRKVLADEFGVNRQCISNILCGRVWNHVALAE